MSTAAVLFRFPDDEPGCRDTAMLVALGDGAAILAERWADYAQTLPETNWTGLLGKLATLPLADEGLLAHARKLPCIVAITGPLSEAEAQLAKQLVELDGHCTVVVDADTALRPEWKSVLRLPPHRSRDAQWAWGMRVYLDAMLNRGLICLDTTNIHAFTANRLSQLTVVHAKGEGRAIAGAERAMQSLGTRLDLNTCDTFLLLFHTGPDIRLKEIHWGIQAFKNAVRDKRGDDYLLMVGHLPHYDEEFAVSLMAGLPQLHSGGQS